MSNQILDFCRSVLGQGLPISCVSARSHNAGASWTISISVNAYMDDRESDDGIIVDRTNLPPGVECKGLKRWPDQDTDIIATDCEIKEQISEVAKIGQAQDWAKFERKEEQYIAYITKPRSPAWWWMGGKRGL
jgi:hypothetical protein